ncbi:MMPL family transporter [Aliikangiella marina]|uniref:MMPL family transporter n=1 Tax=Aliikangiella marina TaxID=1712262 RepID=A0A545T8Y2_9GAMM|nr:MMPL family transporter [Aliikangiella marina]TQV73687.1 MMPL family transporter [Aliikangiella marina]
MERYLYPFYSKVLASPIKTIIIALVFLIALFTGLPNLSISNDFRVYLSKDNPQLQAFEQFERDYVKSDSATFVVTAKEGDVFTRAGLTLIEELTEASQQVAYAYRISSLTNYVYSTSSNDEIESRYLVEQASSLSDQQIAAVREIAFAEKRLIKNFMTADGKLALVFIILNLPKDEADPSLKVTEQMETIRDKFRKRYPQFQIDNGGSTALNATLARAVASDLTTLVPLSYIIVFTGLFLFLRSMVGTIAIFILITSCLLATFGFFGWVAPLLTPIAGFAPSVLLSIMVADSVHILVTYYHQLHDNKDQKTAMLESLKINFMPVFITSITTIIGFLSLNFSTSPPYRDLGNMVAFGVFIALLFSVTLLPALMMVLPVGKAADKPHRHFMSDFAEVIIRYKKRFLIVMSLLTIGLVYFIPNNKLSDNWSTYFDDSFEIMQLVKRIDGYLSGINVLEYSFQSNTERGIFDPKFMQQLEAFEAWFETQNKVVKVTSITHLMKDLNQLMHNDNSDFHQVPESAELAAQYLLFYEFGLPAGVDLTNQITMDKSATRFSVSISEAGSDELLALDAKAQQWLQENAPAIKLSPATGLGVVFAHIAQRNIVSLLQGTLLALVGISLILIVVLKSVKFGMISLVPNLIPAAMAYGLWGMTFGYVDIALSIVACSTLGIVVDDTVHFLHKYILARRAGNSAEDALRSAFKRVGIALLTTTTALAGGFLILAISHMNSSATIGILMAVTLIFALVVDFLLLPPLLLYFDKGKLKRYSLFNSLVR